MHPSISETNCLDYHQALQCNAKTALLFCYVTAQECRMAAGTGLAEGERGVESGGGQETWKECQECPCLSSFPLRWRQSTAAQRV